MWRDMLGERELHFTADVLKDGKITIPLTVRKALGIEDGHIVAVTISKVEKPEGLD